MSDLPNLPSLSLSLYIYIYIYIYIHWKGKKLRWLLTIHFKRNIFGETQDCTSAAHSIFIRHPSQYVHFPTNFCLCDWSSNSDIKISHYTSGTPLLSNYELSVYRHIIYNWLINFHKICVIKEEMEKKYIKMIFFLFLDRRECKKRRKIKTLNFIKNYEM